MKKEELLKFYNTYKIFIFPAVVSLCSLILIVFVIYPQIIKLIGNQKSLGDLTNKSEFLATKVSALESYNGEDLSKKVGLSLYSYPQDKDFGFVIGLLQNISSQSGYSIVSISLGDTSKADTSYTVKMELIGSSSLLPVLVSNIENSPRLMRVASLETSSKDTNSTNVALTVDVLYSPLPKSFGSDDSPLPSISADDEQVLTKISTAAPISGTQTIFSSSPRGKTNPFE